MRNRATMAALTVIILAAGCDAAPDAPPGFADLGVSGILTEAKDVVETADSYTATWRQSSNQIDEDFPIFGGDDVVADLLDRHFEGAADFEITFDDADILLTMSNGDSSFELMMITDPDDGEGDGSPRSAWDPVPRDFYARMSGVVFAHLQPVGVDEGEWFETSPSTGLATELATWLVTMRGRRCLDAVHARDLLVGEESIIDGTRVISLAGPPVRLFVAVDGESHSPVRLEIESIGVTVDFRDFNTAGIEVPTQPKPIG